MAESIKEDNKISGTIPELNDFVKEWCDLDISLADLRKKSRILNTQKNDLSEKILKIMEEKNIDKINMNDGVLKLATSKKKGSLKQEYIETALTNHLGDPTKVNNIRDDIYNQIDVENKTYLKKSTAK